MRKTCRGDYTNRQRLKKSNDTDIPRPLKRISETPAFNWKSCCFICENKTLVGERHTDTERKKIRRCEPLTTK